MPKLTNNERSPFTDIIRIPFSKINSQGTTPLALAKLPAGAGVELVGFTRNSAFAGTGPTFGVGVTGAAGTLVAAATALPATDATVYNSGTSFLDNQTQVVQAAGTERDVLITFAGTFSLTAGELLIGLRTVDLKALAK